MTKKWLELIIEVREDLAEDAAARIFEAGASAVEQRDGAGGASVLITHIALEDGATRKLRAIEALLATLGVKKKRHHAQKHRGSGLDRPVARPFQGRSLWGETLGEAALG